MELVAARVEFVAGDSSISKEIRLRRSGRSDHLPELRSSESHWKIWPTTKSRSDGVMSFWDETLTLIFHDSDTI